MAEDEEPDSSCPTVGPRWGGSATVTCAGAATEVALESAPPEAACADCLRWAREGVGTWLHGSGSRALGAGEYFHPHVAESGPSGTWSMVLDEGSEALFEFRADAVDSSPATFHRLRVADDCEQESPLP